jgi:Zn-dependent metalloprotease
MHVRKIMNLVVALFLLAAPDRVVSDELERDARGIPKKWLPTPPPAKPTGLPHIRRDIIPHAEVELDPVTNYVIRASGGFKYESARLPHEAASQFLSENFDKFGIAQDLSALGPPRTRMVGGPYLVEYHQVFEGLPVSSGYLKVLVSSDFEVLGVHQYLQHISSPRRVFRSHDKAGAIAAATTEVIAGLNKDTVTIPEGSRFSPEAWLFIEVRDGIPESVWRVEFASKNPDAYWHVNVDPQSLEVQSVVLASQELE